MTLTASCAPIIAPPTETKQVFTSTNESNQPMRSLLQAERWSFSGELSGLDEGDPELVFYRDRR
jgi:hypothetical protein